MSVTNSISIERPSFSNANFSAAKLKAKMAIPQPIEAQAALNGKTWKILHEIKSTITPTSNDKEAAIYFVYFMAK